MSSAQPSRGEIWLADLRPTRGHERSGVRPCLIVSVDPFNHSLADLVVVVPLTTTARGIPLHVPIEPPDGGTRQRSFAKCEDLRSIAKECLVQPWGTVAPATLAQVERVLRLLLGL